MSIADRGIGIRGRGKSRTRSVGLKSASARALPRRPWRSAGSSPSSLGARSAGEASLDCTSHNSTRMPHAISVAGRRNLSAIQDSSRRYRGQHGAALQQAVLDRRQHRHRGMIVFGTVNYGVQAAAADAAPAAAGVASARAQHQHKHQYQGHGAGDRGLSRAGAAPELPGALGAGTRFSSRRTRAKPRPRSMSRRARRPASRPCGPRIRSRASSRKSEETGVGALAFAPPTGPATFSLASATSEPVGRVVTGSLGKAAKSPEARNALTEAGRGRSYLWEVYQRAPVKKDGSGDFTWKDPVAAKRFGKSMPAYVIGGMDPDFKEQLYHAGKAMDAAGVQWAILSAFRDDYRQSLASGFKAEHAQLAARRQRARRRLRSRPRGRCHRGDDNPEPVWKWLDAHGGEVRSAPSDAGQRSGARPVEGRLAQARAGARASRVQIAEARAAKAKAKVGHPPARARDVAAHRPGCRISGHSRRASWA